MLPPNLCAEGQWNRSSDGWENDIKVQVVHSIVHCLKACTINCEPEGGSIATESTEDTMEEVDGFNTQARTFYKVVSLTGDKVRMVAERYYKS